MSIFSKKETAAKTPATKVKKVAKVKAVAKVNKETKLKASDRPYRILIKPLISEKATMVNALNKYVFAVSIKANKVEIKKAIEELYNVVPVSVNILRSTGKYVRSNRGYGKRSDSKKAIVTLRKGDSIKLYEGI
jgi:large subunit ribosomal protein L23